ncbi:carbohydrate kinase family protein [Celeribacter sp.]|uniref:carbohydrate kinase family protein n=1 Tax=Celeribacter sp. TaxID=1890673 RepID=UPI003A8F6313
MPKYDYSAVGFSVLDVLCRYAEDMPPPGGATFVDEIQMTVAGTAAATAVDCAILGLNGQIVTRVGRDDMGKYLVSKMGEFGVDTSLVQYDDDVQTSASMLPIRPDGSRSGFFVPGTSDTLEIGPELWDDVLDADIIHLGGTGLLAAFDGEPSVALLKRAKELGRTTVFDLIQANPETIAKVNPLLPYIDYFVPSIVEAAAMAGVDGPAEVARWFKSKGVKNAILTLEGDGVWVDPEFGEAFHLPAHKIDVVDTTGCGDSFTAGIIVGLSKGWDIRECARFANAVAANVALGLGSQGKLTSFDATIEAMNSWPVRDA